MPECSYLLTCAALDCEGRKTDMSIYLSAAIWVGLALIACLISKKLGITLALVEILVGVVAGNIITLEITEWVNYLASMGSVMLTFLAGADISPEGFKRNLKPCLSIGIASFLAPAIAGFLVTFFLLGWDLNAAKIAGIALSTTSVAVVYAVMWDTGLNETELGQGILAACFITDLGTVLLLGIVFTGFSWKMLILIAATAIICLIARPTAEWCLRFFGGGSTEGEHKAILLMLLILGAIAVFAGSEAVLPAYVLGLVLAGFFQDHRDQLKRLRSISYVAFVPFYFIKAGSLVSIPAIATWSALGIIGLLFVTKVGAKFLGVLPVTRLFKYTRRDGIFTTLMMATGLTFGTISSLYGLTNGLITADQYGILVTVVISTAVIPTLFASKFFMPCEETDAA